MTVEKEKSKRKAEDTVGKYNYPLTPAAHNIVFIFKKYNYKSSVRDSVTSVDKGRLITDKAVVLPLPQNLQDSYNVKVGPYELGQLGALAGDVIGADYGKIGDDIMGARESFSGFGSNLQEGLKNAAALGGQGAKIAGNFLGRNFLDVLPGVSGAVDTVTGTAVNPHATLKFDGIDLKAHTFNWQVSPRNKEEAKELAKIIAFIKSRMAPEYEGFGESGESRTLSRSLLKYPDIVEIAFTGLDQNYFYYFKPAMINNFSVDYAPNGIALNKGGRPSMMNITMTVTESEIHTRESYTDDFASIMDEE